MSNEAKIAALEIRIKLLEARTNKDNGNIIKALKRERLEHCAPPNKSNERREENDLYLWRHPW